MFFIRLFLANTWEKKSGVTVLVWEKRSIYFAIGLSLREISYVLHAHVLMHTLMTRKSCAVGMRSAILRNYLKQNFFFNM